MQLPILIFIIVVLEFLLEATVVKLFRKNDNLVIRLVKQHHFSMWRYFVFLGLPLTTVLAFAVGSGGDPLNIFIAFAVIGTAMEWIVGFAYHRTVGTRLWTYHNYSINGYTSLLSVPIWGIGGVLFWIVATYIIW